MHSTAVPKLSSPGLVGRKLPLSWQYAGLLVILLAAIFCTWPGMASAPFQDDIPQLDRSSSFTSWTEVFQPDAFSFFRPVKNALFMAAAPLETNPYAWHWIALAAYLAAIIAVFRISSICLKSGAAALLAAGVWALSPTCASTAIWLSCANISIGIVFAAGMFHFHERAWERSSASAMVLCLVFYAFSLLCYESLIAVPGLLFFRDFQQGRIKLNRGVMLRYGAFTVVALAFLIVRIQFSAKNIGANDFHTSFDPSTQPWQLSLSAPWFLWRHFLMWVFPFGHIELLGSYAWLRSASAASLVFGWVFLAALLAVAGVAWKRFPAISYGLIFFLVASLPAGNFLPGFNGPINDAYLTIPSIGLAMVFAMICVGIADEFVKRRRQAEAGLPILGLLLVVLLVYRLPASGAYFRYWAGVWQDPIKLILLMSETRPYQFQARAYASSLLFNQGYIDQAEALATESALEAPWNPHAKLTMARIADFRENHAEAERRFIELAASPKLAADLKGSALIELAEMLSSLPGREEDAAGVCRELLKAEDTPPRTHLRAVKLLSRIYQNQGSPAKARSTLERGLTYHPGDESLLEQLGSLDSSTPTNR